MQDSSWNSLEMEDVHCSNSCPHCFGVEAGLLMQATPNDHRSLLVWVRVQYLGFVLEKEKISKISAVFTLFLSQPVRARCCPFDLQILCHRQRLWNVRVVGMECLLTDLQLGRARPGLSEPPPWCAEPGSGHWEALPGAGREGSVQRRRERAAAALPQVPACFCQSFLENPLFGGAFVQGKASLL